MGQWRQSVANQWGINWGVNWESMGGTTTRDDLVVDCKSVGNQLEVNWEYINKKT